MDPNFIPIETVPTRTPFGLDQLRRSYKTSLSAENAIAACPDVGTADEVFSFMFLMPITTPESSESATRVDLVYMGCMTSDGDIPSLPIGKREFNSVPASATSQYSPSFSIGAPVTFQFYAPTNTLTWISTSEGGLGPSGDVDAPAGDPVVYAVIYTPQSIPPLFTGDLFAFWYNNFFSVVTTTNLKSTEIVPNQYWLNVKSKNKLITPPQIAV